MKRFILRLIKIWLCISIGWCLLYMMFSRVYLNQSVSEAKGYYLAYKAEKINKNDMVLFCVRDKKHADTMHKLGLPSLLNICPHKMPYILKTIVGVPGDEIIINENIVLINNKLYTRNIKRQNERFDLELIKGSIKLNKDQFFVVGKSYTSYDSRYFGIINKDDIKYKALLIWKIGG